MDYARATDSSAVLLAAGGFFAGLISTSRTLAWILSVRRARRAGATATWLAPLVLHSGPWVLTLVAASTCFVSSNGHATWLAAWVGGLLTGPVFIAFATARTRIGRARTSIPLTPERLAQKRRAFHLINISVFGIGAMALSMWEGWFMPDPPVALIVVCALGALNGWLYSLVMWQLYRMLLEGAEQGRRRRAAEPMKDA